MSPITLEAPDTLRYLDRTGSIGATVYKALAALLKGDGRIPIPALSAAVWGKDVPDPTLWSLCHRVSAKLESLGCPHRCGVDCGDVTLV